MPYCPSQDWDRYARDSEADSFGKWISDVSKSIADIDPYWNAQEESEHAIADDISVLWGCRIKVTVPYNEDLENDDTALIIRTLTRKGRDIKAFPLADKFAAFVHIPSTSPSWRIIPNTERACQAKHERRRSLVLRFRVIWLLA